MTPLGKIAAQRDSECWCCRTNVSRRDRVKARRAQRRRERQDFRRSAHVEAFDNRT